MEWIGRCAAATAELIFRLAQAAQVKLTPEIATCLYTAVLTDTGSFCYSPTNACTFELAKELLRYEHGADPNHIAQNVYFSSPISKMRLLGAALSRLEHEGPVGLGPSITRHDMERFDALDEDCEGTGQLRARESPALKSLFSSARLRRSECASLSAAKAR